MTRKPERTHWVSYLRVSTAEQAERELSLTAQRRAVGDFAGRHGAVIDREYVEPGASGTDRHRPVLTRLLGDVLQPTSTVGTIVVHHTSRFARDATYARVAKSKLRDVGVRVLSVSQDLPDDPMGTLMEGFFECIDQYESELNGIRTAAAMREAVRQGYYPGGRAPYGFSTVPVEVHPGVVRHRLVVNETEADVVREIFSLYVSEAGSKVVARVLAQRGRRMRNGELWSKDAVLSLIAHPAVAGTLYWGRSHGRGRRDDSECLSLAVEPIVDAKTFALAKELRQRREPSRSPGRAAAKPHVLSGLIHCGKCSSTYQLETSGKRVDGTLYRYCYYNCRRANRTGVEACPGFRIATELLDQAVLGALADMICSPPRVTRLATATGFAPDQVREAWRALVTAEPDIGRGYVLHLIERIDIRGDRIVVTPRAGERIERGEEIAIDLP
ncbi:MAG: recombinase family protein [Polyangiaceae bacterium]|nr:recombinase family protein [Polyangiaceae bacterium]